MKPLVTRTSEPVRLISDDVIAQFVGHEFGQDMAQDQIFPILYSAAIEAGEHLTGAVWAQAGYTITRLPVTRLREPYGPGSGIVMPIAPVFEVAELVAIVQGVSETALTTGTWDFVKADPANRRPWGVIAPMGCDFPEADYFRVECSAGWEEKLLPEALRAWALVRMATLYDYREDLVTGTITSAMPRHHTDALLDRWRVYGDPYA